jgi:hypothetical protein
LRFKTDGSNVKPGFQISYRSVLVPNVTIIGIDVFAIDNEKYINSHSEYPNTTYPDNYDRSTTIEALDTNCVSKNLNKKFEKYRFIFLSTVIVTHFLNYLILVFEIIVYCIVNVGIIEINYYTIK